jgi:2-iminobutanoate/2-iminopropanoate deaminase
MHNSLACAALAILCFDVMPTVGQAQTFEKKNYNYSEWTKGRFSEAVTVIGPGKMIFPPAGQQSFGSTSNGPAA